jgi:hypothetical protein
MATVTYVVDPLNILTMGLISGDPLNLITDGFVTAIIEEEIIEDGEGIGSGDFGQPWDAWSHQNKKKKKKKITARVFIDDKEYTESVIVDDLTVNVKDVRLELSKQLNEIKINIILPEEK